MEYLGNKINKINKNSYSELKGQVVWLFGLSGSGKSTIADKLEEVINSEKGIPVYRLDGDSLRMGLNNDLGFSEKDRLENVRRTAEVAMLFANAGFIVIVSLITPLQSMRTLARKIIGNDRFIDIYVKASLESCESRDPKGLYKKARKGDIEEFTGIDSPFDEVLDASLIIDTEKCSIENSVEQIIYHICNN